MQFSYSKLEIISFAHELCRGVLSLTMFGVFNFLFFFLASLCEARGQSFLLSMYCEDLNLPLFMWLPIDAIFL